MFFTVSTINSSYHYITGGPYSHSSAAQAKKDAIDADTNTYTSTFIVRRTEPLSRSAPVLDSENEHSREDFGE